MKNLIISPTGDESLFEGWYDNENFDLVFLYYSNSEEKFNELKTKHKYVYKVTGEKWKITKNFIESNLDFIKNYDTFWFPDDDIKCDVESVKELFNTHNEYGLSLSQPSVVGFTSHKITNPQENSILRFTNFVEIMCPVMDIKTLMILLETFNMTESGYGLDLLWPKMLGFPVDKISVIDKVIVEHTKPVGGSYVGRFKIPPINELHFILNKYGLSFNLIEYSKVNKI